jgi:predicted Zn-dependent peptidase
VPPAGQPAPGGDTDATPSGASVDFKIPMPDRWEYSNGLVVFHKYDEELPLVEVTLFLQAGSLLDPPGLGGVASATAHLMRSGGTKSQSPDELDDFLNNLGATITAEFDRDLGQLKMSCLASDLVDVLPVFYEIAAEPRFDAARLGLWKHLAVGSVLRRSENAEEIAQMVFESAVFGPNSAFARQMTLESADRINRNDIVAWHQRYIRPVGSHLAVTGAISPEELKFILGSSFEEWKNSSYDPIDWPRRTIQPKSAIYVVNRATDPAQILIGHSGPTRMTSDHYSIEMLNRLFGMPGFDSLLNKELGTIPSVHSASGGIEGGSGMGVFKINVKADSDDAGNVLRQVKDLSARPISQAFNRAALADVTRSIERKFMSQFSDTAEIVRRAASLEHLGFSSRYEETYLSNLSEVTPSGIQQAARKWINPSEMVYVVVGDTRAANIKNVVGNDIPVYDVRFEETPIFPGQANFVQIQNP